jgi:hypothetical protein
MRRGASAGRWLAAAAATLSLTVGGALHFAVHTHAVCPLDGRLHAAADHPAPGADGAGDAPGHSHDGSTCPWALLLHGADTAPAVVAAAAPPTPLPGRALPLTVGILVRAVPIYALAPSHSPPSAARG